MKNSTRFVSAILAAILCGAAFSACANEVKPPVTDVTTDAPITDAPATIAPVTIEAPETTEAPTTDAPITETSDISTATNVITTEDVETTDTPATAPSTTAAPATDAPSVTTEATVTITENVADPSEPTETLAKTIAEVLYLGDDGNVHVKGCDSFYLPTKGYYIGYNGHADRVFVIQNTPKGNLPEFYTKYVTRLEEKYNSVSLRPTYHTDVNGNRISLNYVKHRYSTNGVSVSIATSDETDKQYVVTVFPNGNHNICESSIDFNIAEFYGDFGVIASASGEMREESKIWITRDGGKTFEFFANRPIRDLHIMPCGYLYLFESDTKTAFYPGQESTVYHIYKIKDNALIEETPKIADKDLEYNTRGSYSFFSPIFDGNIGVWPVNIAYYDMDRQIDPGTHYLYFYLSTDYGETWERYDPAVVGIDGNTIIYRDCYAPTTDTTTEGAETSDTPATEPITEPITEPVTEPPRPQSTAEYYIAYNGGRLTKPNNSMPLFVRVNYWSEDFTLPRGKEIGFPNYTGPIVEATIKNSPDLKVLTIPDSVEILSLEIDEFSAIEKIVGIENLSNLYLNIPKGSPILSDPKYEENGGIYIDDLLVSFIGDSEHFTVRDGTRFISNSAFENCTNLKTVTLPESLVGIFDYAFKNSGITELVIPSATNVSYGAFVGASSLKSLTLPSSAKQLDISLENTPKLETLSGLGALESLTIYLDETSPILTDKTHWEDGALYIEGVLLAIDKTSGIEALTIKEGTRVISKTAFQNADSLKSVTIPNGVEKINDSMFFGCDALAVVNIPASVKTIGKSAFQMCKSLESITVPLGVTEIGDYAFSGCEALKTVGLPSTLLSIGREAFSPSGIREINLPDGLTSIGYKAFYECKNLDSIIVPDSVTDFGKYVFIGCSSLKEATIPARFLGEAYLFAQCTSLEKVVFDPAALGYCHSIGDCAFAECTSLKSFDIPWGITEIEPYAFYKCKKLEPAAFPQTLAKIQVNAFTECPNFTSIDLPEYIEADPHAFGVHEPILRQVRQAMLPWYIPDDPGYEDYQFSWNGFVIK